MVRQKCTHRYKGIWGIYHWRMRDTRDGYTLTEYLCQIKGCKHWKVGFKHKK